MESCQQQGVLMLLETRGVRKECVFKSLISLTEGMIKLEVNRYDFAQNPTWALLYILKSSKIRSVDLVDLV